MQIRVFFFNHRTTIETAYFQSSTVANRLKETMQRTV